MRIVYSIILLASISAVLACGGSGAQGELSGTSELPAEQSQNDQLPSGHPPIANPPPGMTVAEPPVGSGTGEAGMTWKVPEDWTAETPTSSMRRAQYRVSGEAGDGECVVYYFGPGQGGDPQANALRWADQFGQPDGRSSREVLKTREIEVAGMPVLLTEVSGIYSGGMAMMGGPAKQLSDYMLLGAIAQGPDANWFFKFTGPEATVEAEKEAFETMIGSLKGGAS